MQKYKHNQALFHPARDSRPSPLLVDLLAKERVGVVPTIGMTNMANAAKAVDAKTRATAAAA